MKTLWKTRAGRLMCTVMMATAPACAQPALNIIEGTSFDLGNVYRGVVATKTLTLRNTGTDTLRIAKVDVSCGCTGTRTSRDVIAPGDTGSLLIAFNSSNFAGPVHKNVTVHTNVPGGESVMITFTGKVIEEIALSVRYLMFQNARLHEPATSLFKVTNGGTQPLILSGYRTQLKGLRVTLPPEPIPPGETADVLAEFTPEIMAPVLTDGVFIVTNNPHQSEIYLSVYGNVVEKSAP